MRAASVLLVFLSVSPVILAQPAFSEEPIQLERIAIPERSSIYQNCLARLLRSQADIDRLVGEIAAKCRIGKRNPWGMGQDNTRRWHCDTVVEDVASELRAANIDFSQEFVAVLFITLGSGSISVTIPPAELDEGLLTLALEQDRPQILTADMAYRAFAVRLPRRASERVRIPLARGAFREYQLPSGTESLPPTNDPG